VAEDRLSLRRNPHTSFAPTDLHHETRMGGIKRNRVALPKGRYSLTRRSQRPLFTAPATSVVR